MVRSRCAAVQRECRPTGVNPHNTLLQLAKQIAPLLLTWIYTVDKQEATVCYVLSGFNYQSKPRELRAEFLYTVQYGNTTISAVHSEEAIGFHLYIFCYSKSVSATEELNAQVEMLPSHVRNQKFTTRHNQALHLCFCVSIHDVYANRIERTTR